MQPHLLSLTDVGLALGGRQILSAVTVGLPVGVSCLLGENGAGKTSLIRVMAGVQQPTRGVVTYRGDVPADQAYRRRLGWVPQSVRVPHDMKAVDFLHHALWLKRAPSRSAGDEIASALHRTAAEHLSMRRLGRLSGGEQRRVMLAAALVGAPEVLLLDEPTVGLDPPQREAYLATIAGLRDVVVVLSTHILEDVLVAADTVAVLRDGHLGDATDVAALRSESPDGGLAALRRMFGPAPS